MIRGICYFRKSNEDEGESISQQRKWAAEVSARHGVQLVESFEDQSVSGWDTARRSGFLKMIEYVEQQDKLGRPVQVVVCWHANRFSRANSLETSAYLFRLVQAGCTKMLTDGKWIDFNKSEDRMIFGLEQEATSHRFSIDLSAACKRGKKAKADKGLWTGGAVPYGYRVQGAKFVIDEPVAEVVRRIFNDYAGGRHSLRSLGIALTGQGTPSPKGGRLWSVPTLVGILKNPAYLGHLVTGRKTDNRFLGTIKVPASSTGKRTRYTHQPPDAWRVSENAHPHIVTQDVFDRVQARFSTNRKRTSPTKAFVLAGLVKCGGCGGPMVGHTFTGGGRYYNCGRYTQFGRASGCQANSVREERLLTAVLKKLDDAYFNEATMSALRDEVRRQEQAPDAPDRAKQLTARIEELEKKVAVGYDRLFDMAGELAAGFEAKLLEAQKEVDRLKRELEAVRAAEVPAEDLDAKIDTILGRMKQFRELMLADPVGANVVLREMIDRVVLHFDNTTKTKARICRFARGAIYLSECSTLTSSDLSGVKCVG